MLNLVCAICTHRILGSDNVSATQCGHIFHDRCIENLFKRKTSAKCPQCRSICSESTIFSVYFNLGNLDVCRIDGVLMHEQLENAKRQLLNKDSDLQKAEQMANEYKEKQQQCLYVFCRKLTGFEKQVKRHEIVIQKYIEHLKLFKINEKIIDGIYHAVLALKKKIETMEGISMLLASSTADANRFLQNKSDPQILSTWIKTLKRGLRQCENKIGERKKRHRSTDSVMMSENKRQRPEVSFSSKPELQAVVRSEVKVPTNNFSKRIIIKIWVPPPTTEDKTMLNIIKDQNYELDSDDWSFIRGLAPDKNNSNDAWLNIGPGSKILIMLNQRKAIFIRQDGSSGKNPKGDYIAHIRNFPS